MLNQIAMKLKPLELRTLELGDIVFGDSDSPFSVTEFEIVDLSCEYRPKAYQRLYCLRLVPRRGRKDIYTTRALLDTSDESVTYSDIVLKHKAGSKI